MIGEKRGGTLTPKGEYFLAQFSIGDGSRKGAVLTGCAPRDRREAEERRSAIAALVSALRDAGHTAVLKNIIKRSAVADRATFVTIRKMVARILAGKEPGLAGSGFSRHGVTFSKVVELWTTGELAKRFPDHVATKKPATVKDDERMLAWACDVSLPDGTTFGERLAAEVSLDDCDHVMGALARKERPKKGRPGHGTPGMRRQYAQAIRRCLGLSVYPLRLREANPLPKGWLPKVTKKPAKSFLYPSEEAALLGCTAVPLARRVFFGTIVREGMRDGEALSLTWADLDLDRGVLRLDQNKTEDPRSWVLGEDVALALAAWKKVLLQTKKARPADLVFPLALLGDRGDLAHHLREGLKLAKVDRPELYTATRTRLALRVHDLRGTFVTLALAVGRTEAWVTDRTGHKSSAMIYRYKRASRTAAELELGWLAPLDRSVPELANGGASTPPKTGRGGPQRVQTTSMQSTRTTATELQPGLSTGIERHRPTLKNAGESRISVPSVHGARQLLIRRSRVQVPLGPLNTFADIHGSSDLAADAGCSSGCSSPEAADGNEGPALASSSVAPLEHALEGAARAGRWDIVAQLARELEARRLASTPNVVPLTDARRRDRNE